MEIKLNKVFRLLGLATRAGEIAFGTESVIDTINRKKAKLVIIAQDASDRTKRNLQKVAEEKDIPFRIYGDIESLSKSIGKDNKAVIAIKNSNFSNEIINLIDGGEVIG